MKIRPRAVTRISSVRGSTRPSSTNQILADLAREGAKQVLVCPVAFVSDHVETLYEIRMLFADEARALGIPTYAAVDGLNDHPSFIEALADISRKALLREEAR